MYVDMYVLFPYYFFKFTWLLKFLQIIFNFNEMTQIHDTEYEIPLNFIKNNLQCVPSINVHYTCI